MPRKSNRPAGMRARRERDGTLTFYMVRPGGEKLVLGADYHLACCHWVEEQHARLKSAFPTTAVELLDAFSKCSLPLISKHAAVRRKCELTILQNFFAECGNPPLTAIRGEDAFFQWYKQGKRASSADALIRMFRLVWKFGLQLEATHGNCPWKSVDLGKARLQMEAVDIVHGYASAPLKEVLEEILGKTPATANTHCDAGTDEHRERLQAVLKRARGKSVTALRACGRLDLIPPVYQLELTTILALQHSPYLEFIRPTGRIQLGHERNLALRSLRAKRNNFHDVNKQSIPHEYRTIGPTDELASLERSGNLSQEGS